MCSYPSFIITRIIIVRMGIKGNIVILVLYWCSPTLKVISITVIIDSINFTSAYTIPRIRQLVPVFDLGERGYMPLTKEYLINEYVKKKDHWWTRMISPWKRGKDMILEKKECGKERKGKKAMECLAVEASLFYRVWAWEENRSLKDIIDDSWCIDWQLYLSRLPENRHSTFFWGVDQQ